MALKVDYVAKEMASNLRRNITLTMATVVTIALTLSFVGAFFLANKGVERANIRYRGNVQFVVFMKTDASQAQIDAMQRTLTGLPQVKSNKFLDHEAAYAEFKEIFADRPELWKNISAADLPTNFKVFLKDGSSNLVLSLTDQLKQEPGVYDIAAAPAALKKQEKAFANIGKVLIVMSIVVGGASLVLIVNSIRVAMFSRRREIEVMKLVGATNWFIRIPFMAEGLVQGVLGAVAGIFVVFAAEKTILPSLLDLGGPFAGFRLEDGDVFVVSFYLLIAGSLVGIAASAGAATRYLDV